MSRRKKIIIFILLAAVILVLAIFFNKENIIDTVNEPLSPLEATEH